jgi:hypothetical protein
MRQIIQYLLLFLSVNEMYAQWSTNTNLNTPICTAFTKQNDPRIIQDGNGGAFITWKDERNGLPDIYVQRINKDGYILWTLNGISACDDTSDQSTPNLVTDMQGGIIVSWSDRRTGIDRDVFVQRIDSTGSELWTHNGVAIATKPNREHNEKICSDGAGGAIIVWEQEDAQWDVWAQRVNNNGVIQWTAGGIPLTTAVGNRINPKIQKDGKGGAIVTWQDNRTGFYDIYAQRIDALGNYVWSPLGLPICLAPNTQSSPKIDPSNSTGGAYITWTDKRNGIDYDIYVQKIDSSGNLLFAPNGIPVCIASGNQSAPDILSNKVEGVIICWKDNRATSTDIYAQRIDAAGNIMWTLNGAPICTSPNDQLNPNICEDMQGGAIIVWQDSSNANDYNIKAQRVDYSGNIVWALNGEVVCNAVDVQKSPKNISDDRGGSIFVWQDKRSGSNDIYAHHFFSNGTYIDNTSVQNLSTTEKVLIYPNPTSDYLYLNFIENISIINIYDVSGKNIFSEKYPTNKIDLSSFSPSLYFLEIIKKDGATIYNKIEKQ